MKLRSGYVRPDHEDMDICALGIDPGVVDILNAQGVNCVGDLPEKDRQIRGLTGIGKTRSRQVTGQRYILWKEIQQGMYDHAHEYELVRRGYSVVLAAITPNLTSSS